MTQKHYTKQEMKEFWHDIFNPKGEDLIDCNASGLMCQYLIQIEEELENQSMTQRQLSVKSGVSYNTISECFNLNRLMNFRTLAKIELALGIEFELKQLKKKEIV